MSFGEAQPSLGPFPCCIFPLGCTTPPPSYPPFHHTELPLSRRASVSLRGHGAKGRAGGTSPRQGVPRAGQGSRRSGGHCVPSRVTAVSPPSGVAPPALHSGASPGAAPGPGRSPQGQGGPGRVAGSGQTPWGHLGTGGGGRHPCRGAQCMCVHVGVSVQTRGGQLRSLPQFPPPLVIVLPLPTPRNPPGGDLRRTQDPPLQRGHPKWLHSAAEPQVLPMPGQVYKGGGAPPPSHPPPQGCRRKD